MAQQSLFIQAQLPSEGEQEQTYPQLIDRLKCVCSGGAQIRPSPIPSGTVNIGDIIADHARVLSNFTSAYSVFTIMMRMISCIIDVLCAVANPFSMVSAMARLFGECLPEFLLIFPQFAIVAIILCYIKIIVSIIEYIFETLAPLLTDLLANINDLINAFAFNNTDAQAAVAFKIASLVKEIYSIVGILSALAALSVMINAILALGVAPPCGGSGGSCSGCGDDQCPSTIQNDDLEGTDGVMIVIFGEQLFNFELRFFSSSAQSSLLQIRDFFPRGLNYNELELDKIPYKITIDGDDFAITGVDSGGTAILFQIPNEQRTDGYLSSVVVAPTVLAADQIRFGTDTPFFDSATHTNKYLELLEKREGSAATNSGTWYIDTVLDEYNVILDKDPSGTGSAFDGYAIANPTNHIYWRLANIAPGVGGNKTFLLDINHEELVRHGLIGLGCHPAVKTSLDSTNNRFPDAANISFPTFPDLDSIIASTTACLNGMAPENITSQYVLDNYGTIATGAADLQECLEGILQPFQDDLEDFASQVYTRIFDRENTTFTATPETQEVGKTITVSVIALDIYGNPLGTDLPPGIIEVDIFTTAGDLSPVSAVLDENGAETGEFRATLVSFVPVEATLTASVGGIFVSDFDGVNLNNRQITVNFVDEREQKPGLNVDGEASTEPLGAE